MIATLLLALAVAAAAPQGDIDQIRARRAISNAAIAAHDAGPLRPLYEPDATVIRGSGGAALRGADAIVSSLAASFADPDFVTWERTPDAVTISQGGRRAAETGRWTGRWTKPGGDTRLSGVYLAVWVKRGGEWRLRSESFVTLKCDGGPHCAEVM
jgi:ketosteroid isomerase-like protein